MRSKERTIPGDINYIWEKTSTFTYIEEQGLSVPALFIQCFSPFGSLIPGRLRRTSSLSRREVFSARRIKTWVLLSRSVCSHGHEHELRNHSFSELKEKTLNPGSNSNTVWILFNQLVLGPLPRSVFKAPSTLPPRRKISAATVMRQQREAPSSFPNKPFSVE